MAALHILLTLFNSCAEDGRADLAYKKMVNIDHVSSRCDLKNTSKLSTIKSLHCLSITGRKSGRKLTNEQP